MPSEQDELCPFCGNAPEPEADAHYYGISGKSWRLCCPQCGARGPQTANSEEMAHVLWNIRARLISTPAPAPVDARDGVDEVAEHDVWHANNPDADCGDDCEYEPSRLPEPLTGKEASEVVAFARLEGMSVKRMYATLLRYSNLLRAIPPDPVPIDKIAEEIADELYRRTKVTSNDAPSELVNATAQILRRHFTESKKDA